MPYTTGYTVGSSTTSGTIDPIWQGWNTTSSTTTTSFSVNADVWRTWSTNFTTVTVTQQFAENMQRLNDGWEPSPEELQARRELREQQEREVQSRLERQREMELAMRVKREEAEARGWALLRSVVPAEDIQALYLKVRGGVFGRLYRIYTNGGIHGNVFLHDEHGCRLESFCGAPQVHVGTAAERSEARRRGELTTIPNSDAWLGQYLALKYNETGYLSHANRSVVGRCHQAAIAA
jgi:hypothetical protein